MNQMPLELKENQRRDNSEQEHARHSRVSGNASPACRNRYCASGQCHRKSASEIKKIDSVPEIVHVERELIELRLRILVTLFLIRYAAYKGISLTILIGCLHKTLFHRVCHSEIDRY
jgi:hypothetical protein